MLFNGCYFVYIGYDDKKINYENNDIYLLDLKLGKILVFIVDLDCSVEDIKWDDSGSGFYFSYDSEGKIYLVY